MISFTNSLQNNFRYQISASTTAGDLCLPQLPVKQRHRPKNAVRNHSPQRPRAGVSRSNGQRRSALCLRTETHPNIARLYLYHA